MYSWDQLRPLCLTNQQTVFFAFWGRMLHSCDITEKNDFVDFYGKTRKRSAIIRNNGSYLLENIQLSSTLITLLLSFDCITGIQSRLIQRKRSNLSVINTKEKSHFIQGHHSVRYKNTELLCTMRSFDVTKFLNCVTCLRQANQKTVARILENGGGSQYVLNLITLIFTQ